MTGDSKTFELTVKNMKARFDYTEGKGYTVGAISTGGVASNLSELADIASQTIEGLTGEVVTIPSLIAQIVHKLREL